MDLLSLNEGHIRPAIFVAVVLLIVTSAIPFVPGAEVGFALLFIFGAQVAPLVYLAMVTALLLAFLLGRLVPLTAAARFLGFLGLQHARALVLDMAARDRADILPLLASNAPARLIPLLLRHRYLAILLLLNLPGNSLLGGGGGLAFVAGFSRVFSFPAYLLTVLLAVAPIPLYFVLMA